MIFVGVEDPENVLILIAICDRGAQIIWLKQNNVSAANSARVRFNFFPAYSDYSPIHAAKRAQLQHRSICLGFSHIHHITIEIASYVLQIQIYYHIQTYTILFCTISNILYMYINTILYISNLYTRTCSNIRRLRVINRTHSKRTS